MAESEIDENTPKSPERRRLLIGAAKGLTALAIAKAIGTDDRSSAPIGYVPSPEKAKVKPPETLPDDVLTEKELKEANITIYKTKDVKLYLRKSAIEIPGFKDSAKGKNGGIVIALIDSDAITWGAVDQLPPDAKSFWQALHIHPDDFTDDYWNQYFKLKKEEVSKRIGNYNQQLEDISSGKEETKIQETINLYEKLISDAEAQGEDSQEDREHLLWWQERKERCKNGELEIDIKSWRDTAQEDLERTKEFEKDPKKRKDFILESSTWGQLLDQQTLEETIQTENIQDPLDPYYQSPVSMKHPQARYTHIKNNHPEWIGKTFIYLCVGGRRKPHPDQSYQGPNDYEVNLQDKKEVGYHVIPKDPDMDYPPGYVLRHEIGHYGTTHKPHVEKEARADEFAFQSLGNAWRKYYRTGDNSGYSFIFATKEGLTFTRNFEPDKTPTPAI